MGLLGGALGARGAKKSPAAQDVRWLELRRSRVTHWTCGGLGQPFIWTGFDWFTLNSSKRNNRLYSFILQKGKDLMTPRLCLHS